MPSTLSLLAGVLSTMIFAASVLPMVVKARRTRDLRSYSRSHLVLANVGNGIHSVYVLDLPPGPIWALHSFYLVTSALMLAWHVRYAGPLWTSRSSPTPAPPAGALEVASRHSATRRRTSQPAGAARVAGSVRARTRLNARRRDQRQSAVARSAGVRRERPCDRMHRCRRSTPQCESTWHGRR